MQKERQCTLENVWELLKYNMYNFLYYNYFCFAKFFKANVPGSFYYNTSLDGVLELSLMEFLNVVALAIWMEVPCVTTTYNLDLVLLGIIILGLNSLYFLHNKRYKIIVENCDKADSYKKAIYRTLTVFYSFMSFYLFYLAHSSM